MVAEEEEGDQTLASLPANSLRGTFWDAYHVLTSMLKYAMCSRGLIGIGWGISVLLILLYTNIIRHMAWDELLMYRSQVFLMEDGQQPTSTKPVWT